MLSMAAWLVLLISLFQSLLDTIIVFMLVSYLTPVIRTMLGNGIHNQRVGVGVVHPRKLNTKKWSTMDPSAKSANALYMRVGHA